MTQQTTQKTPIIIKIINSDGVLVPLFGGPCALKPRKARDTSTPCGSPKIIRADLSFGEKGAKIAKPGEALDLDAMIQAALPSCDISAIVARAKMGDESVLNVNPGFVGDAVSLPKDLYDYKRMNDLYDKVAGSFNSLPDDLKALFNNNASDYLNALISNKADEIVKKYNESHQQENPAPAAEGDNK